MDIPLRLLHRRQCLGKGTSMIRERRTPIGLFFALVLAFACFPLAAFEVPKRSLEARVQAADLVILGEVVSLESSEPGNRYADGYATVQVTRVLKGDAGRTIRLLYRGGISEATPDCCTIGSRYLMILRAAGSNAYESVDGPYGVFETDAAAATRFPVDPVGPSDARVLHARVLAVSDFPRAGSGIMKMWFSIDVVENGSSTRQELLMIYLSEQQAVPKVRDDCLFTVHRELAGGFIGRSSRASHLATVVDDYRCGDDMPKALKGVSVSWPGIAGP